MGQLIVCFRSMTVPRLGPGAVDGSIGSAFGLPFSSFEISQIARSIGEIRSLVWLGNYSRYAKVGRVPANSFLFYGLRGIRRRLVLHPLIGVPVSLHLVNFRFYLCFSTASRRYVRK